MTIDELGRAAATATRRAVSEAIDIDDALNTVGRPPNHRYVRAVMAAAVAAAIVAVTILAFELLSPRSTPPVKQPAPATITQTNSPRPDKSDWEGPFFFDVGTEERTRLPKSLQRMTTNIFRVSPDGTQLAFATVATIYVADVDGTHIREVANGGNNVNWSPDGNSLVYSMDTDAFVLDLDTGQSTKLIDGNSDQPHDNVYNLNFSPDGQTILFTRWHAGALALWTIPASGGPATVLLDDRVAGEGAAFGSYSPDGSTIAFRRTGFDDSDITEITNVNIFLADADGSHVRSPTGGGQGGMSQIDEDALWPVWSPDGEWLAYEEEYGHESTTVLNINTEEWFTIRDAVFPSWLDNHTLIFMRTH